jgi:hypothetical protein
MTQLSSLLSQIDSGSIVLPEFQRGYVWSRDQVRGLMRSLYLGYPVGGLLVWEAQVEAYDIRNPNDDNRGRRTLLLDGQQRMTSLYGVIRGKAPEFFEGDDKAFLGLHFNVQDETFEFHAPAKMNDNPLWVNVTDLFVKGLEPLIARFNTPGYTESLAIYIARLSRLNAILGREFHLEKIVGEDKTTDVVVDIFNRVNSGGTKLSKGDLALAKISAADPSVRQQMRKELARWNQAGYSFELDWLLRNVTAVATGKALFASLDSVSSKDFEDALTKATSYIDTTLNLLAGRLGLDHGKVLLTRYAIPVITRYLHLNGGIFPSMAQRDKVLYWYIHAGMWGRFSGSTETKLAKDYDTLESKGLDGIIDTLRRERGGSLRVNPSDFTGFGMGARFYPMLYLLTRVRGAQDLGTGVELKKSLLGKLSALQVHHTFPKKVLYDAGYSRSEVNAVANFIFLTQETNLAISKTPPAAYLPDYHGRFPHALASQWIPADPALWQVDRYVDFLDARRQLLAATANDFLDSLLEGSVADEVVPLARPAEISEADPSEGDVEQLLSDLKSHSIVYPQRNVQIDDPETGRVLAIAEAFWPDGLQPGRGEPTVLELDPDTSDIERLQAIGYRVFTSLGALRDFADREAARDAGTSGLTIADVEPAEVRL